MLLKITLGAAALAFVFLAGFGAVHAQSTSTGPSIGVTGSSTTGTSTGTGTTVTPTTPGTPNTGMGGDATSNALLLGASALVLLSGSAYVMRLSRTNS